MRMTSSLYKPGNSVAEVSCDGVVGAIGGTYIKFVGTAIEYCIVSDLVRGEGRVDIQLTILDEEIFIECGCHFKFVIADHD